MSGRSHIRSRRPRIEHQRLLHFVAGLGLWAFALLVGVGAVAVSVPLSALLLAVAAGALLTTVGAADHRDRPLLTPGDFAIVDGAVALALIAVGLGFLIAGESNAALVFCATATVIGLGASVVRYV
jgi:hypothetical protein